MVSISNIRDFTFGTLAWSALKYIESVKHKNLPLFAEVTGVPTVLAFTLGIYSGVGCV